MVLSVIIIFKGGEPSVLVGPEVSAKEQRKLFKQYARSLTKDDGEKIELWNTSTGRSRRKRLKGAPVIADEPDLGNDDETQPEAAAAIPPDSAPAELVALPEEAQAPQPTDEAVSPPPPKPATVAKASPAPRKRK